MIYLQGGYANNLIIRVMDDGSDVTIGNKTTINGAELWVTEGMDITIGQDCMFAKNIELRTGDNHGANAKIMKGVLIPSGSVIGNSSLVTRSLEEENAIYAGVPAKLIKSDICWYRDKKYRL